jgi:hypothetical protein
MMYDIGSKIDQADQGGTFSGVKEGVGTWYKAGEVDADS